VKIFCPFTPQAAAGLSCAVTQEPRYDQRLISALAMTQPKAVTVAVVLVRSPNRRQLAEDLSRYVGAHSCNTLVRCLIVNLVYLFLTRKLLRPRSEACRFGICICLV
jgi:hypothetical protein